jgi:adenylate cyclase
MVISMEDAVVIGKEELQSAHTRAPELRGEVLCGPERRRRWSTEEKLRVLAQSVAIGDRVMVIFDVENCFKNAISTAIAMNSVAQHIINKHFKQNEVNCSIGIDYGKMLATKTGYRRHGHEQHNYRNLVWLGRPANIASKLIDIANKPKETVRIKKVQVADNTLSGWVWKEQFLSDFVSDLDVAYVPARVTHKRPSFASFFMIDATIETRAATKPILMTNAVFDGYRSANPSAPEVINNWFTKANVSVPNFSGTIYGGDVIYTVFKS